MKRYKRKDVIESLAIMHIEQDKRKELIKKETVEVNNILAKMREIVGDKYEAHITIISKATKRQYK